MRIGPIQNSALAWGQSPHLDMQARAPGQKTRLLFDTTRAHAVASEAFAVTGNVPLLAGDPITSRALLTQCIELAINAEWQQCGIYVTFREDGVNSANDGWYLLEGSEIAEISHRVEWASANLMLLRRYSRLPSIGGWFDSKAVPDDYLSGAGGIQYTQYPAGLDLTNCYPPTTFTLTGRNGNVGVNENAAVILRAPFSTPTDTMTKSRCFVYDENFAGTPSTASWEVFWKDHVNQNGYTRITNDLLRYTLHVGDAATLIEVWSAGAWVTLGSYNLQAYNGTTYFGLTLQGFELLKVSPEEVEWEERRYDAAGSGLVVVRNRIRRGSRIIESLIVAASGIGLAGTQSIGITGCLGNTTLATSVDLTGAVATVAGQVVVPGFAYITKAPNAATVATTNLYSGLSIASGTLARISIIAGLQDAIYTAVGTAALYAAKQASYNRQRVKQRILVGA